VDDACNNEMRRSSGIEYGYPDAVTFQYNQQYRDGESSGEHMCHTQAGESSYPNYQLQPMSSIGAAQDNNSLISLSESDRYLQHTTPAVQQQQHYQYCRPQDGQSGLHMVFDQLRNGNGTPPYISLAIGENDPWSAENQHEDRTTGLNMAGTSGANLTSNAGDLLYRVSPYPPTINLNDDNGIQVRRHSENTIPGHPSYAGYPINGVYDRHVGNVATAEPQIPMEASQILSGLQANLAVE
jgi:hypothetical protein